MPNLLLNTERQLTPDEWVTITTAEELTDSPDTVIVPPALWQAERTAILDGGKQAGILLANDTDLESLTLPEEGFAFIAVDFPKFVDGRGFSIASHLRKELGYQGEIRAVGNVIEDQLLYLSRCGFTSMVLPDRATQDIVDRSLSVVTEAYQADVVTDTPLFRRRG